MFIDLEFAFPIRIYYPLTSPQMVALDSAVFIRYY